jgi:hypothetical protein
MDVLPSELVRCDPGGRFVAAASAFLETRLDAPLGRGAAGVRALTALLLRHAREDDGRGDEAFIEGCGAALGLVLAEALEGTTKSRDERHLVLLGEHGAFDPFSLVRQALDADDPREVFSRGLHEAEREARGEGPVAASIRAFVDALERLGVDARITDRFALEVTLDDGAEVDLTRVHEAGAEGASVARHLARMLTARSNGHEVFAELKERVLPRVVGDAFVERLGASAGALAKVHIAPGLHLALIAHYGDRARFLRQDELDAAGEPIADVCRLALLRLAHKSASVSFRAEGDVLVLATRDGLDASRILLPSLPRVLTEAIGAAPFVAAPHRDLLLSSASLEAVRALALDAYARAPHGVSPRVYRFESGRVVSLD